MLSASGKLSADAKGLLSRFVGSAGAEINGEALEKKFEGVIQEQLGPERDAARHCRGDMAKFALKEVCKSSQLENVPAIRAECDWRALPQRMSKNGRMYFLPIDIAVDPRNLPDGLQPRSFMEFFGPPEAEFPQIINGHPKIGYTCKLTNHSDLDLFNIYVTFDVRLRE